MMNLNQQRNQRGFTLVEVIVVAIIVAALAGVAIPMYTSYVKTSHSNAAANAAGSVASFMGSCINQTGAVSGVASGSYFDGGPTVSGHCLKGTDTLSNLQFPANIRFSISSLTGTGSVKAYHTAGGDTATYNY